MKKRNIVLLALLVLGAGAALSAGWFVSARNAEHAVLRWADRNEDDTVTTKWSAFSVSGYPFRVDGRFTDPTIDIFDGNDIIRWRAPTLDISFSPLSPSRMRVEPLSVGISEEARRRRMARLAPRWDRVRRRRV